MNAQHNWTVEMPEKYYPRGERFAVWTDGAGRHFFSVDDRSHSLVDWRSEVLVEILRLDSEVEHLRAVLLDVRQFICRGRSPYPLSDAERVVVHLIDEARGFTS